MEGAHLNVPADRLALIPRKPALACLCLAALDATAYRLARWWSNMHDARAVANFLLDRADEMNVALTNMEILKHIYFAHGWHLVAFGKPLITNRIEAWQYGPVIRAVYDSFKNFDSAPITSRATLTDWATGEVVIAESDLTEGAEVLITSTLAYYSGYRAFELSEMTHAPGGAWDRVWNAGDGRVRMNMEITNSMIRNDFERQASEATRQ